MTRLSECLAPGSPHPLGATVTPEGVNLAVFSAHASRIEWCVFDADGVRELRRYALHGPYDGGLWCGLLPGAGPGLVYGLRAHGPWQPEAGHRFNPHKLLLDPLARELVGRPRHAAEHHAYVLGHPEGTRSFDPRDNATVALKARVAAPAPPPPPCALRHRASQRVLYEVQLKSFSMLHPGLPPTLRGSYAALAHPAAIAHLRHLGVTTVSLLPVQQHLDEAFLAERGRVNHWGYNTLAFCCPQTRFAHRPAEPGAVAAEFRAMVAGLHAAGIEVVLDIVFNHTAEGNEAGPSLSWRGLDQASWYRMADDHPGRCLNWSHCGNTVNAAHPRVMQWVLDVLRFWVGEMGVDGFRFDLAPVLGRDRSGAFRPDSAFFAALRQDPILARSILIAEAWDGGPEGYQVGRFPAPWLEWNDRFRDAARAYWLQPAAGGAGPRHGVGRGEFARRLTGSSDLFQHGGRAAGASVNFIAAHDGFTLADLTAYSGKRNAANGEDNRDGRDGELCSGLGADGPSDDPAVNEARRRVRRALLATLAMAAGTPMLLAGDELGNSQQGNNNAWCQDNPVSWLDWPGADTGLIDYVARLFALRRAHPMLTAPHWPGESAQVAPGEAAAPQRRWLHPAGHEMQVHDWHDGGQQALACCIEPAASPGAESPAPAGSPSEPRLPALLMVFNPETQPQPFHLGAGRWRLLLDSSAVLPEGSLHEPHAPLQTPARSLLLWCAAPPDGADAIP